jgi:hypothetical protein
VRFLPLYLFLVVLCWGGGCRQPTMAEACADRAFTACDLLASCRPIELSQRFGDHDTCVRRLALECTTNAALPDAVLSPSDVEGCVHELTSGGCDALSVPAPVTPVCSLIQRGGRGDGARCGDGIQCQSGVCDTSIPDVLQQGCGRCALQAAKSTPCGPTNTSNAVAPCDSGLYCNPNSNVCFPVGQEGDDCLEIVAASCDPGLACVGGTCQRLRGEGDDCQGDAAGLCDRGRELACDAATGRCARPSPAIAGVGDACDPFRRDLVACGPRSLCVEVKTFGMSGTCKAVRDDGQSCDPASPVELCLFPTRCIDGQCGLVDAPVCREK